MLEGLRILAIEDDVETAESVRSILEEDGHEVHIAADGRKALAELAGWRPDLIILDLLLPALSGHALLRYLRELPEYRQVPVLVLSGALASYQPFDGASAVLRKPFEVGDLVALVSRLRFSMMPRDN